MSQNTQQIRSCDRVAVNYFPGFGSALAKRRRREFGRSIQTTRQKSEPPVQNKTAAISKLLSVADLQWTKEIPPLFTELQTL